MDISTLQTILEKGFISRYEAGFDEITAYADELYKYAEDQDPEISIYARIAASALLSSRELLYGTINSTFDEFVKIFILFPKCNDPLVHSIFLNNIGNLYIIFGVNDLALQSFERSDQLAIEHGFDFLHFANLISIGAVYSGQKQFNKFDKLIHDRVHIEGERSFAWFEFGLRNNEIFSAIPFKPLEQLEPQIQALISNDAAGQRFYIAQILDTYGELLEFNGETDRAIEMFQKAYDAIDPAKNNFNSINIMLHLSNALMESGHYVEAEPILLQAEQIINWIVLRQFLPELHRQLAKFENVHRNESREIDHHILYHLYTTEEKKAPVNLPDFLDLIFQRSKTDPDRELTRMDVRAAFYDKQTGLWDRFLFHSIGFRIISGKRLSEFCLIAFKLNEGTQFKPRSLSKVLKYLGEGIRDRIGDNDIACRYANDSVLIMIHESDLNEAYQVTRSILNYFLVSTKADVEPWIASMLDIGVTRGSDHEKYLLQVIDRLSVEMYKNRPASGGMIMTFEPPK